MTLISTSCFTLQKALFETTGENKISVLYQKSRNLKAAIVLVPGCRCLATWAVRVRAAHLLQTAEGRRALLETTRGRHWSIAELSTVRMEAVRLSGASSRCWSRPWTDGAIAAVPPVRSRSPRAEVIVLSLGDAVVPALCSLWCYHHHSGYKSFKILITIYTNCWLTNQGRAHVEFFSTPFSRSKCCQDDPQRPLKPPLSSETNQRVCCWGK